jgi:methionine-rich copper-binding protein CopC
MKKLLVLFAVTVLSCAVPTANAHSELVSSNPSASTYIEVLPEQIELEFNEELLNLGSGNSVFNYESKRRRSRNGRNKYRWRPSYASSEYNF